MSKLGQIRPKRKAVSKRVRFEVFKRDNFACQYCGAQSPDVILHVDHINPVAGGGDSDIMNLVTSCEPCNLGKGAKPLDDNSVIAKQKAQLNQLNARREQLEMMVKWREGLRSIDDDAVAALERTFSTLTGRTFTDFGKKQVKGWLRRHTFSDLSEAMENASDSYWKDSADPEEQAEQAGKVFKYTPIIIAARKRNADKPWMKDLYWCRAVIRNRHHCNDFVAIKLLEEAYEAGIEIEDLKELSKQSRSWTAWRRNLEAWIEEQRIEGE